MSSLPRIRPTAAWTTADLQWVGALLTDKAPYSLYFHCQLEALNDDLDNRGLYIGRQREGVILSIQFDGAEIFTTYGSLDADELMLATASKKFSELHVDERQAAMLLPSCEPRLLKHDGLLYYRLDRPSSAAADSDCRILTIKDFEITKSFYRRHYPETIFSSWMLELPFVGLFSGEELVAAGGTVIWHRGIGTCNIGNFLTHPEHRGKGLARKVAKHLIAILGEKGISTLTLGTNAANVAAQRVYESLGFRLLERRRQIDLRALSEP